MAIVLQAMCKRLPECWGSHDLSTDMSTAYQQQKRLQVLIAKAILCCLVQPEVVEVTVLQPERW